MEKDLILNGKKYISSRRASALVDYTSDYVGQLCRGGKIRSTLIGKTWYVDEESILAYKKLQLLNQNNFRKNISSTNSTNKDISDTRDAIDNFEDQISNAFYLPKLTGV